MEDRGINFYISLLRKSQGIPFGGGAVLHLIMLGKFRRFHLRFHL